MPLRPSRRRRIPGRAGDPDARPTAGQARGGHPGGARRVRPPRLSGDDHHAIAAEAGVSKRTVYNHFDGKEQLFTVLMAESATQVADRFAADVERTFAARDGPRALTALGEAFAAQRRAFPEHFALVAQVRAQERQFPADVIDSWQEAGPLRVQAEVARRLAELADRGLLRLTDPARAALHSSVLVTADLPRPRRSRPPSAAEAALTVAAGVEAFLHGLRARDPRAATPLAG